MKKSDKEKFQKECVEIVYQLSGIEAYELPYRVPPLIERAIELREQLKPVEKHARTKRP